MDLPTLRQQEQAFISQINDDEAEVRRRTASINYKKKHLKLIRQEIDELKDQSSSVTDLLEVAQHLKKD